MVYILKYSKAVRSIHIVAWIQTADIVCGRIPIKPCIRMSSGCMVIYDVENYRHASFVTFIDELFIHGSRTICLIHGKI